MMALNREDNEEALGGNQPVVIQSREDVTIEKKRGLPRVRSGSELSAVFVESK